MRRVWGRDWEVRKYVPFSPHTSDRIIRIPIEGLPIYNSVIS